MSRNTANVIPIRSSLESFTKRNGATGKRRRSIELKPCKNEKKKCTRWVSIRSKTGLCSGCRRADKVAITRGPGFVARRHLVLTLQLGRYESHVPDNVDAIFARIQQQANKNTITKLQEQAEHRQQQQQQQQQKRRA